jgi:hypothetical protein
LTLLAPIPLSLIAMVGAILGGLLVIAYILKMRRRRFEVPFSTLWHRVLKEKEATSLWKHLKRILSLLLMALIVGMALVSATEPRLGAADADARNVIIILDTSASMQATDEGRSGDRPRMEVALEKARELIDAMGAGDAAMVLRMDGQTTPLSRFETDKARLKRLLGGVRPSDTPADLRRALSAAADALHERQNPLIVLIGDGAYPSAVLEAIEVGERETEGDGPARVETPASAEDRFAEARLAAIDLRDIDVRFIGVGKASENVGIVAFNVRRYVTNKLSYEVFIEVQNFGTEPASRKLVLFAGESPIDVKELTLAPGERRREIYGDLGGGDGSTLRAVLQSAERAAGAAPDAAPDAFGLDDVAHALLPERKKQKVLLVTRDNLYLEGAMLVYDNIQVDKLTPDEYEAGLDGLPDYHAVAFDDYTPSRLPPERTHLLYFNPQGPDSPFEITGVLRNRPKVTETDESHPVMRWITMTDVNFDQSSVFAVNRQAREASLIRSIRSTMAVAKRDGPRKVLAFGWSLGGTDLMLRVAFPLLLVNSLDWFAGDDADLITTYTTGKRVKVPLDGTVGINEVEVVRPGGHRSRAPVTDGRASFYASSVGLHQIIARDGDQVVATLQLAANLSDPDESAIAARSELAVGGGGGDKAGAATVLEAPEGFAITRRASIWLYLALLVLLLLGVEWFTYNRRITV